MNNKKYSQIFISVLIVAFLFFAGFYAGRQKGVSIPSGISNATSTGTADFSPYWKAWQILDQRFAGSPSTTAPTNQDKVWGSIEGLASSYGDPYTVFFPPVESKSFEQEISGSFGGVGMEVGIQDGTLTVVAPLKGSPAEKAGVRAGDKIVMIGEKNAAGLSSDEAVSIIRGEVGTPVTLTLSRSGEKQPLIKTIVRENIVIPTVDTKQLPSGVFVISLYNFSANSPELFRSALRKFVQSGSDKLVLDLRNNPGGYLEAALDMASWFLPTGKTVVTEDFGSREKARVYKSKGYDVFNDKLKFAILVNGGSASASEILAGALQEYGRAKLVGTQTFGKGSVQELMPITGDTSLKVTVAHWLTPLGKTISNGGLTPDIKVPLTKENTADGKDPQMEAAVNYLTK